MNHLGIDYEDTLGNYVGSLDGITYGKIPVGSLVETILTKSQYAEMGDQDVVMKLVSRQRLVVDLT